MEGRSGKEWGTIAIREFTMDAAEKTIAALDDFAARGVAAITLDLRNNPGGLLDAVRQIGAKFVSDKEFACRRDAAGATSCEKTKAGGEISAPLTVLVNEGTASAAEILAAGIQRTGRGKVVGCKTYGHGYGGQFVRLSDGSALLIPDTTYLDAKGEPIEGSGITPDEVSCGKR